MEPKVSLIIPTTGERPSLAAAVRSALAQDFPDLEIIVVDDAASGTRWTQAGPFPALLSDPRVRVVPFGRRTGCAAAKNAGWAAARGVWLCYLDDDNEYRPGKVRAQHELAAASDSPVVLCGLEYRAGGRSRIKQTGTDRFSGDGLLLDTLPDTNVLFHRRDVTPRWDEELGTADDACLFQAILASRRMTIVPNVTQPLVIYHSHGGERANRDAGRHYRGQRRLLVRWAGRYSRAARRVQLCRHLVAADKLSAGRWRRLWSHSVALLRAGGPGEWRTVANAIGVKLPLSRRWMVT